MDSKRDTFDRAAAALVASTPDQDFSQVLSIIEAGTEAQVSDSLYEFSTRDFALEIHVFRQLSFALERLVTRLPNDEDNMNSILIILNYFCSFSYGVRNAVRRFGLPEHIGKILKSHQHEEIIINSCLRLVTNLSRYSEQIAKDVVMNERNLNVIESIIRILWTVLEKNVPSETTLMLSLSSLYKILKDRYPPQKIIDDYEIVKALGYAMVKFIDEWKTSEENHETLCIIMEVLKLCSNWVYKNICFELKNTGRGDAMLLLSDLIVIPSVSETVTDIVLNFQRDYLHYSHVPLDDIYGKIIEKLRDTNAYTDGTDDEVYELFLHNFCQLLNAERIPENLINTATVSLLNALQSHVQPTEASLENCKMVINTLRLSTFKRCLRLMLDSGILSILSSKLDWFLGVENQLDLHHDVHEYRFESRYQEMFESQFYDNLDTSHAEFNAMRRRSKRKRSPSPRGYILSPTRSWCRADSTSSSSNQETDDDDDKFDILSADTNEPKHDLVAEIVILIERFANLKPTARELSSSDIVYKLLLLFLPKNKSLKPLELMTTIMNIIMKPKHLINLLTQTQFVYAVNKLCIPKHSHCLTCIELFDAGHWIMKELTKVVERTIENDDIAYNLFTASPTVKEALVVALPFFAVKMSTLNNLMITCGGLDLLMDVFRRETAQREYVICSLNVLAKKIKIKDPTDCTDNFNFDDNNDEVTTVLEIENYQLNAGHIVTFKLDDDSCVQADRDLLASKSDFFNPLLFGQFKESHEEVVRLPETPHDSFKLVLMLLQLDDIATGDKLCRNQGKLLERVDLAIVLEAIVLCDRFLLKDLYTSLILFVQHCIFSTASVPIIYRGLVDLPAHIFRMEIISYCLVGCMSVEQRNCLFEELLKSENSERFVDDMKNMFGRFLCAS